MTSERVVTIRKSFEKAEMVFFFSMKTTVLYIELCAFDKMMTLQYRNSNKYIKQK